MAPALLELEVIELKVCYLEQIMITVVLRSLNNIFSDQSHKTKKLLEMTLKTTTDNKSHEQ